MFACDMEPIRDFIASSSASYLRFIVEFQWFFIALSVLIENTVVKKIIEISFDGPLSARRPQCLRPRRC